jgi:uncharacterized membrane protein YeaQ/YmgE (transglycosylase-associated protein family)
MGDFVSWIVWGLFVGMIARLLVPGRQGIGIVWTILLGVLGSVIGGVIATKLLDIGDSNNFDFGSFAIAVIASALLLGIGERLHRALPDRTRRKPPDPYRDYR